MRFDEERGWRTGSDDPLHRGQSIAEIPQPPASRVRCCPSYWPASGRNDRANQHGRSRVYSAVAGLCGLPRALRKHISDGVAPVVVVALACVGDHHHRLGPPARDPAHVLAPGRIEPPLLNVPARTRALWNAIVQSAGANPATMSRLILGVTSPYPRKRR